LIAPFTILARGAKSCGVRGECKYDEGTNDDDDGVDDEEVVEGVESSTVGDLYRAFSSSDNDRQTSPILVAISVTPRLG
jgi:hypothetical protein